MAKTTFLVTGGAGFIGSHICERLVDDGHDVRVFDNFSTGRFENVAHLEGRTFSVLEGDIVDADALGKAMKGAHYVIHLAALPSVSRSVADPMATHRVNVDGTLNVLMAARDLKRSVRRVVFASSSATYGDTPTLPKAETMAPQPLSPYAVSKLTGEYYCRAFHTNYDLEAVALRYFNVYGPRQDPASEYAAVVPKFVTSLLAHKKPVIYGDGKQTRDFTYVENVVEANLAACTAPKAPGDVFNIACGERVTIAGLANLLGETVGWFSEPKLKPARSGDVRHSLADISLAEEILGYRVRVNLHEGLERTVDWYRDRV